MGWFTKKSPKSELTLAIEKLSSTPSVENQERFAKILRNYVEDGTWVFMPTRQDKNGFKIHIVESRGKHYATMYSDFDNVKKETGFDTLQADINKIIEPVFENIDLDGIAINPYTNGLFLDKAFLLKCLIHAKYPTQKNAGSPPRNWGEGIPRYTEQDLMCKGELQNFSLHTVLDNDKDIQSSFDFVSANDNPDVIPNLILSYNDKFAFVFVKGYTTITEPILSEYEKQTLLDLSKKYHADCFYAPVGFLSTDPARFEAELALKGDAFYCKYLGLQKVE